MNVIMLYYNIIYVVFIFNYCNLVYAQDSCASRTTCQDCITDPSLCVWCAMNDFDKPRCKARNSYTLDWCPKQIEDPTNVVKVIKNLDFNYNLDHVIQMKPQEYKMKLRPGQSEGIKFSFKGAPDFPVDLYFLLDASLSMEKIRNMTAKQSENIYNTMKKMTRNVKLGLGTFVDKRALPYTTFRYYDSEKTYSFRHRLSLTDNFTKFKETISKTPNGVNRDEQEGGLDGLAQAMVCKDLIGWRNESRKIIVFLTDGQYHAAGDGKLAGIFQPYDGRCYTYNETYTKEQEMDYPSVGMINKLAVERNIIILFYVENKVEYIYRRLSGVISGSKVSKFVKSNKADLTDDSLVKTLQGIYEKISNKVTFKVKITSGRRKKLEISFKPDCTSDDSDNDCEVKIGEEKQFAATVKLMEYDGQDKVVADIIIESIGEKLSLDIDVIKDCDCENADRVENSSLVCHGEKRICGICNCSEKRYGKNCACVKSDNTNVFNDTSTCIAKGSNVTCSGHGSCVCGGCVCRDGFSGTFCDCNLNNCPRHDKELCSGESHGECRCGKCVCKAGWKGEACECPEQRCKEDGTVCSNRGRCGCKGCECDEIAKWDARNQYDKTNCRMTLSPDRHNLQCGKLETCAICLRDNGDECMSCDDKFKTNIRQTLSEEYLNSTVWNVCYINLEVGCFTIFVYKYDDVNYNIDLIVQHDKNCAETYYIFGGIFLVTLILVGVASLVAWKLLTDARDRREYLQFLEKTNDADNKNVNPLYEPPSTQFINPNFRKRSFK